MAGMITTMSNQPSDEVRAALFEQLTERLRRQGYRHPEVAAAALAARADARLTVEAMAERLGVSVECLQCGGGRCGSGG